MELSWYYFLLNWYEEQHLCLKFTCLYEIFVSRMFTPYLFFLILIYMAINKSNIFEILFDRWSSLTFFQLLRPFFNIPKQSWLLFKNKMLIHELGVCTWYHLLLQEGRVLVVKKMSDPLKSSKFSCLCSNICPCDLLN